MVSSNGVMRYAPWDVDYWFGSAWLLSGMILSWWLVYLGHGLLAILFAMWFTSEGWARASRGFARERGVEVERRAFKQFLFAMELGEFTMQNDVRMVRAGVCYGNVDMVVSPVWSNVSYVVEIKAFSGIVQRWYGLCRLGKFYRLWSPQSRFAASVAI